MNGSVDHYTSNFVNGTLGGKMGMFNVKYCDIFNEMLEPNSMYNLTAVIPEDNDGKLLILYICISFCVLIL